jgi:hypothetical protein
MMAKWAVCIDNEINLYKIGGKKILGTAWEGIGDNGTDGDDEGWQVFTFDDKKTAERCFEVLVAYRDRIVEILRLFEDEGVGFHLEAE